MKNMLKYWQNNLLLNNWKIIVKDDCPVTDFVLKDVCGETEWDLVNRCAVIRIISKDQYGNRIIPYDKERILVHELLHIKFSLLWESNDETHNLILHNLIEDMANSLIKTRRMIWQRD